MNHWGHPWVLLLLLLLPPLAWFDYRWGLKTRARLTFSSFDLIGARTSPGRRDPLLILTALRIAALFFIIVSLARPQRGQEHQEASTPATDIMLCVDTSGSMEALDFDPKNRLEAARDVMKEFIKNRPHDRLGLVVFAGLSVTQCPLTLDHGALLGFLDNVKIGMVGEDGTAVGNAIATSVSRLKNSAAKSKTVVLLTDGRSNRGTVDPVTAAKAAKAHGIKIYTVGIGVPGGGKFKVQDPIFGTRLVQLPEDLDEISLRKIADASGGLYFRATSFENLKGIYAQIDKLEKTDIKVDVYRDYEDLYGPLLWLAFFFFSLELLLAQTWLWRFP
jgi:Ca-activated chloride channel family protein